MMRIRILLALCASVLPLFGLAAEATVAVAANFTGPMERIAPAFEKATGHRLTVAYGAVGKFYAQIRSGAPFDVLVSADQETVQRLVKDGQALPETRFTYAIGQLVLWSPTPGLIDERAEVLAKGTFRHLAIANPKVAPYGAAAVEVMTKLGVYEALQGRIVTGESITQAYQFTATGNAELGFVALSQVYKDGHISGGSYWRVPPQLHPALAQDAVLLIHGKGNAAAQALLDYLRSEPARAVIRAYGYSY